MSTGDASAGVWPSQGTRVLIASGLPDQRLGADGVLATVVQVDDEVVGVAVRTGSAGGPRPASDDELEVRWAGSRSLHVVPARLVERAGGPLWWLAPVGSPTSEQRRDHVRASALRPVRVVLSRPGGPSRGFAEGSLVDLSEGGLRVRVAGWSGAALSRVRVRLTVADAAPPGRAGGGAGADAGAYELDGTVLRALPSGGRPGSGRCDVQVQFDRPVLLEDDLRALVFAWQRAARRAEQS